MTRPARGDYACRHCGAVLHSPGALGGHVAQHTRLGRGNPSNDPTILSKWEAEHEPDEWDSTVAFANTGSSEDYSHLDDWDPADA